MKCLNITPITIEHLGKQFLDCVLQHLGVGVEQPFHRSRILGILHIRQFMIYSITKLQLCN